MIRLTFAAVFLLSSSALGGWPSGEKTTTWTGWFSDKGCATAKVAGGTIAPNGTECVKKCLNGGADAVFISEQAKALYLVKDHAALMSDVGYRIELTGVVDEKEKTISVRSVKRLSEVVSICALPGKK